MYIRIDNDVIQRSTQTFAWDAIIDALNFLEIPLTRSMVFYAKRAKGPLIRIKQYDRPPHIRFADSIIVTTFSGSGPPFETTEAREAAFISMQELHPWFTRTEIGKQATARHIFGPLANER